MKAETKTAGINVIKEEWEDEHYNKFARRLIDEDLMHGIFDEIMKGGKKIVTVSELRIYKRNSINMVSAERDINIEEVVCCADCKHFHGDGHCCVWGMLAFGDAFCSHGERREFDG